MDREKVSEELKKLVRVCAEHISKKKLSDAIWAARYKEKEWEYLDEIVWHISQKAYDQGYEDGLDEEAEQEDDTF